MNYITKKVKNNYFDFVLTHTCPRCWEPTDLFISGIDQSAVDKSMEDWLDKLKIKLILLFGVSVIIMRTALKMKA